MVSLIIDSNELQAKAYLSSIGVGLGTKSVDTQEDAGPQENSQKGAQKAPQRGTTAPSGMCVQASSLHAGDFAFVDENNSVIALFERKTHADLVNSIKTDRYHLQKGKLLSFRASNQGCTIYYIIEGPAKMDKMTESAMFHMQFRDKIHILKTRDVKDTMETLFRLKASVERLKRAPKNIVISEEYDEEAFRGVSKQGGTASDLGAKKTRDLAAQTIGFWGTLPGITNETAKKLVKLTTPLKCLSGALDGTLLEGLTRRQMNSLLGAPLKWNPKVSLTKINNITTYDYDKIIMLDNEYSAGPAVIKWLAGEDLNSPSTPEEILGARKLGRILDVLNYKVNG